MHIFTLKIQQEEAATAAETLCKKVPHTLRFEINNPLRAEIVEPSNFEFPA